MRDWFTKTSTWVSDFTGTVEFLGIFTAMVIGYLVWGYLTSWPDFWGIIGGTFLGVLSIYQLIFVKAGQLEADKVGKENMTELRTGIAALLKVNPQVDNSVINADLLVQVERVTMIEESNSGA